MFYLHFETLHFSLNLLYSSFRTLMGCFRINKCNFALLFNTQRQIYEAIKAHL